MSVSSTTSSRENFRSRGLSGLVSGMDTDSMVEKMLQGTQNKIDRQNQQKQLIQWKQVMYRNAITKINTFRNSYFDTTFGSTLKTNLASRDFFNSMASTVSGGNSVKVVGTSSSAQEGETRIWVSELASASRLSSSVTMSGNQKITGSEMDISSIKSTLQSNKDISFNLALDGVTKSISLSSGDFSSIDDINAETISNVISSKVNKAFGTYVGVSMSNDKLSFSINITDSNGNPERGHELKITGVDANLIGITPGASTRFSMSTKLGDMDGISGGSFKFTINGKNFEFSSNDTISTVMRAINDSNAGVKISYSTISDSFSMVSTSTGAQYSMDITQEAGNLLSVMFGSDQLSPASSASSKSLNKANVQGTALADDYTTNEASMKLKVNGQSYTFNLVQREEAYTKEEIETEFNSWLKSTFGESNGTANISYSNGNLNTAAGYMVSFDKTNIDTSDPEVVAEAAKRDLSVAMGFSITGASNTVTGETRIEDVAGLNGLDFKNSDGNNAEILSEIASLNSHEVTYADGRLIISGSGTIDLNGTGLEAFFGNTVTLGNGSATGVVAGKDAKITINGIETSRSSNTFTIDGLTITATSVSTEETVISTARDVDKIVDAIKSFVNDYNEMVDEFYGYLTEDNESRKYPPLTDAQKKEMSDKEIEMWEKKAKSGLLRNDTNISSFMQSMRTALYTKVDSAGIAPYSIGIETTKDNKSGRLTIDESLLRQAIASNPEAVSRMFTDPEDGLAKRLAKTCDDYAKLSITSMGSLVRIAGADGYSTNAKSNNMYNEIKSIDDKLKFLNAKYQKERQRYWNRFNAMESIVAQYSSQSMLFSSYFSKGEF